MATERRLLATSAEDPLQRPTLIASSRREHLVEPATEVTPCIDGRTPPGLGGDCGPIIGSFGRVR
jgi:hypothetical protein